MKALGVASQAGHLVEGVTGYVPGVAEARGIMVARQLVGPLLPAIRTVREKPGDHEAEGLAHARLKCADKPQRARVRVRSGLAIAEIGKETVRTEVVPELLQEVPPPATQPHWLHSDVGVVGDEAEIAVVLAVRLESLGGHIQPA